MKKTLLSVFSLMLGASALFAQNSKTASGEGYIFRFDGTDAENCKDDKIPVIAPESSYTVNGVSGGNLSVTTDGTQLGWHNVQIQMHDGSCNAESIDMTTAKTTRIVGTTTAAAIPQLMVMVMDENGQGPNDNSPTIFNLTAAGAFDESSTQSDWTSWGDANGTVDPTKVTKALIYFRVSWNDNDAANGGGASVNGTHDIDYLIFGDAAVDTGVEEELFGNTLSVFPNPATSDLNVKFEASENVTISLSDITGKVVMTQSATAGQSNFNFDVTDYSKGLYFINLSSDNGQVTKKVMIQ